MGKFLTRVLTQLHARVMKATGGMGAGTEDGSLLVLEHVGAKTAKLRETPLAFYTHNDGYVVCASVAGADHHPGWYFNLHANPETTVAVAKQSIAVRARELTGNERDEVWARFKANDDRWQRYEQKTDRTLPLMLLEPR